MNTNEYGAIIRANVGEDISSAISLSLTLQPKTGEKKIVTSGLTVGATDIQDNGETYQANQYIEYVTQNGDIDKAGVWRKQGGAIISSSITKIGDYRLFVVGE